MEKLDSKRVAPPELWRFYFIMMICFLHFEEDVYDDVHILRNLIFYLFKNSC